MIYRKMVMQIFLQELSMNTHTMCDEPLLSSTSLNCTQSNSTVQIYGMPSLCSLPFTTPSTTASDSLDLVDHLSLHHTTLPLHPVSQGHPVNWTAVGPVLAIFTITAILLALTIILVAALFKQRRTRHTGRYLTTLCM